MKKIFSVVFALTGVFSLWADDVITAADLQKWRHSSATSEIVDGALRARVQTQPRGAWGSIGNYIKGHSTNHFLQIKLGEMESAIVAPGVANSSSNGGKIGNIYTGVNTFKIPPHAARTFYLALTMLGDRREKVGPWIDFQEVRTTLQPFNAPVVTLDKGDTVKVGSKLKITFRTKETLSALPSVRFCLSPGFADYKFNNQDKIVLKKSGDGIYTAEFTVDNNALMLPNTPQKKYSVMALTTINGINCYYTLPFKFDLKTGKEVDVTLANSGSLQVRDDRKLWLKHIRGVNLVRGKKLRLLPATDYGLTKDDKDATDLTDGRLSHRSDDRIWFGKDACGWYFGDPQIYIGIDLGKVQPVEKLVIRCLGGTSGNFKFPRMFNVFVSKDGKTYYPAASMQKLAPCEAAQSNWKNYYYLPEDAKMPNTRMYPFALSVRADARYIILNIIGETGSVFSDELACIKADKKGSDFNAAYKNDGREIPMEGLVVRPRVNELAVMQGLPAPQAFLITDMRAGDDRKKVAEIVLELPKGMSVIGKKGEALANGVTRYIFPLKRANVNAKYSCPVFYIAAPGKVSGTATVYARSGGVDQFKTVLPVKQVVPPQLKPFKRLHISLSWMHEDSGRQWPDFFNEWGKFGFNTVSLFPRYWTNAHYVKRGQLFADAARKAGYKTIMNDSSFHEMARGKKAGHEIYCQIPGRPNTMHCPTYRGADYAKEMDRVRRCVANSKPDYVFYDIETYHFVRSSAPVCTRCKAVLAKSGKSLDDMLFAHGSGMMADLKKAIAQGSKDAGIKMPVIGSYNRQPLHPVYGVELWKDTYPASLDMAQPSLYVAGRAVDVHNNIRANHKLLGNKKLLPWLTTGCYGEFESYKVEQMVLEALMNGACGVTYFGFTEFTDSPLDFYYHIKALAAVKDHEDLIMDGKVTDISGSNKDMLYSMLVNGDEALLLVGNYNNSAPETLVKLPFKPSVIKDLRAGKTISAGQNFKFNVPRSDIRLFYLKK
ncbi:MAG: hypothetical protein IJW23_05730 [Lentisphaeria bacterium]|nr:hypothetical protein [Lentisphaeria bacterium]